MRPIALVFEAADGRPLAATVLEPPRVKGAVVIASATGVPRRIYEGIARCLVGIGGVASAVRQAERAARLLSAAETLLDSIGLSLAAWPELRADFDRYVTVARAQLSEEAFAAAWAEGCVLSLDQMVAEALSLAP